MTMWSFALTILSLVAFALRGIAAESKFLVPPNVGVENQFRDNPEYRIGEAVNVSWVSALDVVDLTLEIQLPNKADVPGQSWDLIKLQRSLTTSYYRWIVDLHSFPTAQAILDKKGLVVLFLLVSAAGSNSYDIRSHYFNVTNPTNITMSTTLTSTLTTTLTSTSPSTSTSTSTSSTRTTFASSTPTTSIISDSDTTDKSSSGAIIGGAVGGALGGCLILGGLGIFIWRLIRKDRTLASANEANEVGKACSTPAMEKNPYRQGGWAPSELHGTLSQTVHEAP